MIPSIWRDVEGRELSLHSCNYLFSSEYCAVHDWVTGAGRDSYSIRRVIRGCGGGIIDPAADLVCRGVDSAADLVCREEVDLAADLVCREGVDSAADLVCREGVDSAADPVCREGVDSAADPVCREGVDSVAVVGLV